MAKTLTHCTTTHCMQVKVIYSVLAHRRSPGSIYVCLILYTFAQFFKNILTCILSGALLFVAF